MIHVPEHTGLLPNSFRIMISVGYERQSGGEWKTEEGQTERRIRNAAPPPNTIQKAKYAGLSVQGRWMERERSRQGMAAEASKATGGTVSIQRSRHQTIGSCLYIV